MGFPGCWRSLQGRLDAAAKSSDADVRRRLACFHVGNHADPEVVQYGLTLLALISLSDHEHDRQGDQAAGKYNPLNEGLWDAAALRAELEAELDGNVPLKNRFADVVPQSVRLGGWWSV